MAETIGQRLRQARESKGLSVEDVAHDTRIHANTLRALEDDDYSGFAGTTYAKSFLSLYSRFLGVDASGALDEFDATTAPVAGGISYLHSVTRVTEIYGRSDSGGRERERPREAEAVPGRSHPLALGLVTIVLMGLMGAFFYFGGKSKSPEELKQTIQGALAGESDEKATGVERTSDPKTDTEPVEAGGHEEAEQPSNVDTPKPSAPSQPVRVRPDVSSVAEASAANRSFQDLQPSADSSEPIRATPVALPDPPEIDEGADDAAVSPGSDDAPEANDGAGDTPRRTAERSSTLGGDNRYPRTDPFAAQ